jgi:hypothetical protein
MRRPSSELGFCDTDRKLIIFIKSRVNIVGGLKRRRLEQLRNHGSIPARSQSSICSL